MKYCREIEFRNGEVLTVFIIIMARVSVITFTSFWYHSVVQLKGGTKTVRVSYVSAWRIMRDRPSRLTPCSDRTNGDSASNMCGIFP